MALVPGASTSTWCPAPATTPATTPAPTLDQTYVDASGGSW